MITTPQMTMRDPGSYPGGKAGPGVYQALINLMPPHETYVSPFIGHDAILHYKRPAAASIGIDRDGDVLAYWAAYPIPCLTVIHGDAISYLRSSRRKLDAQTLVYCDPPYLMETRSSRRRLYKHEMTTRQHAQLLEAIKRLDCMVMISGYWSQMYAEALHGWRVETFQATTRGGKPATEYVWLNFPPPLELHDTRYLGKDFRERERISRKKKRWAARLERMEPLERYALLEAINTYRSGASPQSARAAAK